MDKKKLALLILGHDGGDEKEAEGEDHEDESHDEESGLPDAVEVFGKALKAGDWKSAADAFCHMQDLAESHSSDEDQE